MTIEEMKDKKRELEASILKSLRDFEIQTGTTVHNVDVRRTYITGRGSELLDATLIVRID